MSKYSQICGFKLNHKSFPTKLNCNTQEPIQFVYIVDWQWKFNSEYMFDQISKNIPSLHVQFLTFSKSSRNIRDVKLAGIVETLFLYHPWRFQTFITFPMIFMDPQMSKIGCVNYAHFPKSSHTFDKPLS